MTTPFAPPRWNAWKMIAIGLSGVFATALIAGVVVAHYAGGSNPQPQTAAEPTRSGEAPEPQAPDRQPPVPPRPAAAPDRARRVAARPSAAEVAECNRYASAASRDKATETVKDGLIGGVVGAGLGAASGAIAGRGGGAEKGAGIGGLVGAAAGTLYGLTEGNQTANAAAAYRACMSRRGYVD